MDDDDNDDIKSPQRRKDPTLSGRQNEFLSSDCSLEEKDLKLRVLLLGKEANRSEI